MDGLKTREEFEKIVAGVAGADEDTGGYKAVDWRPYLSIVRSDEALTGSEDHNVGIIVASGEILDGEQPPGYVGGDTLAAQLRELRDDDDYSAVVLRIDSPGGSIMASELIRREVEALTAAGKPVVASMGIAGGSYHGTGTIGPIQTTPISC